MFRGSFSKNSTGRLSSTSSPAVEGAWLHLHPPSTTGEWSKALIKDAPDWTKWEAHKRKGLKNHHGIPRRLTPTEMQELWQEERDSARETPGVTKRGIAYEDYLEEQEEEEYSD